MASPTTTSGLSRRKGSTSSRSGASLYVLCFVVCVALSLVLIVGVVITIRKKEPASSLATLSTADTNNQQQQQQQRQEQQQQPLPPKGDAKLRFDHLVVPHNTDSSIGGKDTLILSSDVGEIRIVLLPQYSPASVKYIHDVVAHGQCDRCTLYRAEKQGILQGIIKSTSIHVPTEKGSCPPGMDTIKNGECPKWDPSCACHGPLMERGMVGWAAGKTGPDFFIDDYRQPAKWWGTQHTVWGQIMDDASLNVIDHIWSLPTKPQGGLTMLESPIKFTMRIEQQHMPVVVAEVAVE
ncbi:hypothetical protein ACA910_003894 [Epithemia clementina (nom. ined.)]